MKRFNSASFEKYVEDVMAKKKIPGVAVTVVEGDKVIYAKGFGYRNVKKKIPVTPDTIFGIASVTKSFTAVAIMQLAEKGMINLGDPVKKYLPDFDLPNGKGDAVTIYHFLTHTSGLPPVPALGYCMIPNTPRDPIEPRELPEPSSYDRIDTYAELMEYLRSGDFEVLAGPGKYCSYSNDAYALLGAIVQRVTGVPYDRYVWENIFKPLGMDRSTLSVEQMHTLDNVTLLYSRDGQGEVFHAPNWQIAPPYLSCGWIKSTAMDLSNFVKMYIGNGKFQGSQIVSSQGISELIAPRYKFYGSGGNVWYGYGLMVEPEYSGATLVSHGGNLKGIASRVGFVPESNIGAVVLTNLTRAPATEIWKAALNCALGLPVDFVPDPVEFRDWPAEELKKVEGVFESGEGSVVEISVDEDKLVAKFDGTLAPIRTTSRQTAVAIVDGRESEIDFLFDENDELWAIGLGGRIVPKA